MWRDRMEVVREIKAALKARSGKDWSVTVGKGTAYSWIEISSPPRHRINGMMTEADREELRVLLGYARAHLAQYSSDNRMEILERAKGNLRDPM